MTQPRVLSERLELTPLAGTAVDALLAGDTGTLERLTGARFADAAPPPYMADALPVVRDRLRGVPRKRPGGTGSSSGARPGRRSARWPSPARPTGTAPC